VAKDEWKELPEMKCRRYYHKLVIMESKYVYNVGGCPEGNFENLLERIKIDNIYNQ
jgi:hypothetical protein